MPKIYLDYQSATPVRPEAIEAMRPFLDERFGNPASLHGHGRRARAALKTAREQMAAFIGASSPEDIIFTSDGTEAMNLAIKGVAWANASRGRHIVTSAIEHPGVLRSIEFLETQGFECARVPVNALGQISPAAVAEALTDQTILVAVHLANHDLGTLQPVAEIGALARERGVPLYVDCEAAAGWHTIDLESLGASLLSFSPHRFYGPRGVGVLYRSGRVPVTPLLHGGGQEFELRAGVENIPAIVGAGVAAELAGDLRGDVAELQAELWRRIQDGIPDSRLNGPAPDGGRDRIINSLNISFAGVEGEGVALAADMRGLAIAAGPACRGRSLTASPALKAIGLDDELARANVLLSLGRETTREEIAAAVGILSRVVERLRSLDD